MDSGFLLSLRGKSSDAGYCIIVMGVFSSRPPVRQSRRGRKKSDDPFYPFRPENFQHIDEDVDGRRLLQWSIYETCSYACVCKGWMTYTSLRRDQKEKEKKKVSPIDLSCIKLRRIYSGEKPGLFVVYPKLSKWDKNRRIWCSCFEESSHSKTKKSLILWSLLPRGDVCERCAMKVISS